MNARGKLAARRLSGVDLSRGVPSSSTQNGDAGQVVLSMFTTSLGWIGLLGQDNQLISTFVGHPSSKSVRTVANKTSRSLDEEDWNPTLRCLIEAYTEGNVVDFSDVPIRLPEMTAFRQQVVAVTRRLGYGETISYGELARRAGYPRAARAVGTVMSTNRFPLVIPCHRVLAAGGKLGGYTSPAGTNLKQRLLELEGRQIVTDSQHSSWSR